jgi:hypothetical protein
MMPSRRILSILTILGLRNPFKKDRLAKYLLYRAYISIFVIIFGFRIITYNANLTKYKISNLMTLVDAIIFCVSFGGGFLIYLESFFYRQELDLIMEEFTKIDKILLEKYRIKIDDRKFDKFIWKVSVGFMIFVIIQACLFATVTSLFTGLPAAFSNIVLLFLIIKFWFICRHLKIRFDKIEKFFSSKADDQILEVHYRMVQTIFLRSSRIIKLSNKFFQFKFLIIFGK